MYYFYLMIEVCIFNWTPSGSNVQKSKTYPPPPQKRPNISCGFLLFTHYASFTTKKKKVTSTWEKSNLLVSLFSGLLEKQKNWQILKQKIRFWFLHCLEVIDFFSFFLPLSSGIVRSTKDRFILQINFVIFFFMTTQQF